MVLEEGLKRQSVTMYWTERCIPMSPMRFESQDHLEEFLTDREDRDQEIPPIGFMRIRHLFLFSEKEGSRLNDEERDDEFFGPGFDLGAIEKFANRIGFKVTSYPVGIWKRNSMVIFSRLKF